jgi:hypothetical protein
MSGPCCDQENHGSHEERGRPQGLRRVKVVAGYVVPGTLLALLPKCPLCLAAYVALGTGFTLSATSAHWLMRSLVVLCTGTLAFCVAKRIVHSCFKKEAYNLPARHTQ